MREISPEQARTYLVGQLGLRRGVEASGAEGVRRMLQQLRVIQLDPLDRIGTNADLVAMARVDGLRRGDVYSALMPEHGFEHFAKERCILPASAFPYYRDKAAEHPWWRLPKRYQQVTDELMEAVLAEVVERGPLTPDEFTDQGRVKPVDWSGWKGTSKAATMAIKVLRARCRVVVAGRRGRNKVYDLPKRSLGAVADAAPRESFERWALLERIEAAGLLSLNAGPHWSMLKDVRTGELPQQLVDEGAAEFVRVSGAKRVYLAPAGFLERAFPEPDDRMRILGPLDPVLWDRRLVEHAFGFEYIWEVYKPAAKRRWGYYVCPLLHRGQLVGRFEGRATDGEVAVEQLWKEDGKPFDDVAWRDCLERHAAQL